MNFITFRLVFFTMYSRYDTVRRLFNVVLFSTQHVYALDIDF